MIITEMGVFEAIVCSKKPEAKELKRWVLGEVIPAVIKYGGYVREDATTEEAATFRENLILDRIRKGSDFTKLFIQLYEASSNINDFSSSLEYILENVPSYGKDFSYKKIEQYLEKLRHDYRQSDNFSDLEHILLLQVSHTISLGHTEFLRRSRGQSIRRVKNVLDATSEVEIVVPLHASMSKKPSSPCRKAKVVLDNSFELYFSLFPNNSLRVSTPKGVRSFRQLRSLSPENNTTTLLGYRLEYNIENQLVKLIDKK